MGLIGGIILTAMLVGGVYKFIATKEYREKIGKEFREEPLIFSFVMFGAISLIVFLWSVFIPALGEIKLPITRSGIAIWQVAGLCALAWMVIGLIGGSIRNRRPRRR